MNRAFTSEYAWSDHHLPLNKANYKVLQLGLVVAGYSEDKYAVLEPLCITDKICTEKRKSEWVQLYINALALGVDLATLPDVSTCDLISSGGADLSGTAATLTINPTGTNNDVTFTAKSRGPSGNLISVRYVDPAANSQSLAVTIIGSDITVSLATGAGGAITSTAAQIVAAVNLYAGSNAILVATVTSGTGAGIVTAIAKTNLAGGAN